MLPPGLDALPPFALYIFYAATAIGIAVIFVRSLKIGAKEGAETQAASRAITAIGSMQPAAVSYSQDELVRTLAGLQASIDRLNARLDHQEMEHDIEERAAEMHFRQQVKEMIRGGHIGIAPRVE